MIGKQIANYRIEDKLGEGGMGVVYKATDVDLDRPVAIKVLSADLSGDPALIERFRSEAKAQALLNHANIASLYTLLNVEGHVGIVMEYLEGETLDQIIQRRGLLPWEEAVPWFKQALLGLGFAHRRGIIHRDIKPSNIMVNRYGTVKVMDFGIAKVIGGQRMTRTGTNVGTVAYMSPEQVRNDPVDIRTDIYCLGVTLYELLTAHLPFESASEFQVMSDHVHTPPPTPRQHYPYIPPGIEAAVLKALAKRPEDRFQSVEEFGAALEHPGEASAKPIATVMYPSATGAASSSTGSAATRDTRWEAAQSSGATAFGQSASAAQSVSAAGRDISGAAVAPRIMAGDAPAPIPGVGAPGAKPGNKKLLYGSGAAAAVLVVSLGVFAIRPKPATVASAQLGGGGQVQSLASSGGSGADSTIAHNSSQQTAAGTSGLDKSDSAAQPSIMQALNADKTLGKSAGTDLRAPNSGRNAGTASHGMRSTIAKSGGGQGTPVQDTGSQPQPNQQQASPQPPPAPMTGPSEAELESANEDLVKMRARMDAVHQSLTTLKQEQAAQGLGLRGDIVASESRLYSFYGLADRALQQKNLTSAQRNMQQAETELEKLEHFLGR